VIFAALVRSVHMNVPWMRSPELVGGETFESGFQFKLMGTA
jgi:hypothetical protein